MRKGDFDPEDWDAFRADAHELLDRAIDRMAAASDGRVWSPVPDTLRETVEGPVPMAPGDATDVLSAVLPYGVGNTHPRFFGWVHGAGSPGGMIAEIAAAAMNVNAGGRNHIAPIMEQQIIGWMSEIFGFGDDASGLLVSGTSLATIIALKVARDQAGPGALVGYTSVQAHACVAKAFDILGLGKEALRLIPCNDAFEMDLGALTQAIEADRATGKTPFLVVGTAGAVNMGAIDDLSGLADIATREGLWFHVDGAFGATAMLGRIARDRLVGIKRADSLAFDFHKWIQVNYDCGFVLMRDGSAHRASFSDRPDYLRGAERGLAGGAFWAVDYGPELSRGFRALKVWAHLVEHGIEKIGTSIDRNIELAGLLADRIAASNTLELMAPVPLQIVCFRYVGEGLDLDALNEEIVVRLQESGVAVPSTTILNGALAIRVNITNHRTREEDIDILLDAISEISAVLVESGDYAA